MASQANSIRQKSIILSVVAVVVCAVASILTSAEGRKFASRELEIADAVQRNGTIFDDWPKPEFAIVLSGEMNGYLEPCGCAGLDNQKGGLKRRHTLFKQLAERGWPTVKLDMGGLVRRVGPQSEMKYRYALKSLTELGYDVVAFGIRELLLSTDAVVYALANLDASTNPMVSANIGVFGFDNGFSQKFKIIEVAGRRIGVTSVLGNNHNPALQNLPNVVRKTPEQGVREVLPELEKAGCDLLVLLAHAEPAEARQLAKQFPQFDYIATAGGAEIPPDRLEPVENSKAKLVQAGHKGMYVVVLGFFDDPENPVRFQAVPLDHRFEDSAEMQRVLVEYQDELKSVGLDGLGLLGVKNPIDGFVGSEACADCHTTAAEEFAKTPHSHATATLVELDPARHFDPECLSCHVTGWRPEKYFPYESGYVSLEKTPHLTDNGCENCHGPGQAHVAAEMGDVEADEAELERLRSRLRLKIVENEGNKEGQVFKDAKVVNMCIKCHDEDNSPEFDFQEYWPHVEHYGKD